MRFTAIVRGVGTAPAPDLSDTFEAEQVPVRVAEQGTCRSVLASYGTGYARVAIFRRNCVQRCLIVDGENKFGRGDVIDFEGLTSSIVPAAVA